MNVIVKSSSLHGAGVYATTEVTYLFGMDDGNTIIDGFGTAAFVNHCCDPNCETDEIRRRIWIIDLRDIAAGEELTYDYNLYDGEPGEDAACYCGVKGCRGTMFSEEEVARQKRILLRRKQKKARMKSH